MNPQLRRPLVAGNWKLYKTLSESIELARDVVRVAGSGGTPEVVVAPVFTALAKVADVLAGTTVGLSAQNVYWETQGAFTGEVGPLQLADLGCRYAIVGHSERRQLFGDTDEAVQRRTQAALRHGLRPIVCVGETLSEREAMHAQAVVVRQLKAALTGLEPDEAAEVVIAYEPVWAIGTGKNAQPSDAQEMHARVRSTLTELFGQSLAEKTRILYGGSVKPDNAKALMAEPDVDGALVGGASLSADSFCAIVAAAR
ncbi:MAG TPA: triose-phosphate isomerase [Polyangiales bacterium]|jgi:triosephosphate isomerase